MTTEHVDSSTTKMFMIRKLWIRFINRFDNDGDGGGGVGGGGGGGGGGEP